MLNPKSKKNTTRKKKRLEDILGAEQRYTPLEITLEDGTLGSADMAAAAPFVTKCKCILVVATMLLLLPIIVYFILNKSGFEISIHPKQTPPPQENQPPTITGVAQPKQATVPSSSTSKTVSDEEQSPTQDEPIDNEDIPTQKSNKPQKTVANNEPNEQHDNNSSSSRSRPIPSLAKIDGLKCANDLNTNYDETFQYFHEPDASFCRESNIVRPVC